MNHAQVLGIILGKNRKATQIAASGRGVGIAALQTS
jgi:hypothetical protein